jgi:oligopeptide transport system substrate-binding protein
MSKKLFNVAALLVVASMLFTACAPTQAPVPPVTVVVKETVPAPVVTVVVPATPEPAPAGAKVIYVNTDGVGDVPTLDPNVGEDTSSITIIEETFMGLTRLDEVTSALHPGMASTWDISKDGKTYTFHLRNDVPWVKWDGSQVVKVQTCPDADGKTTDRMVTAKDFEYGILRALKPATASPYAYVLGFVVEGANDYNSGVFTDTSKVGVKALDDQTLEVKFIEAAAYNANIIGLWTANAVPQWLIEGDDCTTARGERWTEPGFFQSYGPFTLKEWVHDSTLTVIKNPFWVGDEWTPQPKVDEVTWSMLDAQPAFTDYEAGNLDAVNNIPLSEIDRIKSDPTLSKEYVVAPNTCTYYYGFNTKAEFVDDPRVRRALSMAVDRQDLIDNVLKGGQRPAQWFAYPGLAGSPTMEDYPDLGVKYDVAKANAELDAYLKDKNLTKDKLDLTLMFNTSSNHEKIAVAVQQMWKTNLGIDVKVVNQEWKVFLETTKSKNTPQIYRMGWCMDYPDANNWDREVVAVNGSQNPAKDGVPYGGFNWKNDKYEELVQQAAVEMDAKKRVDMYAQAEQIAMYDDAVMIPLYWYTRNTVTKPYVTRTFSVGGHERYEHWDIDMSAKGP